MTMQINDLSKKAHGACTPVGPVGAQRQPGLYRNHFKRLLDLLLVVLALPIVLPLIGVLALVLGVQGGRPFYCSDRVGREGRTFRMVKLRTMVVGADEILEDYLEANPAARQEWNDKQKLLSDPRVTRFGRFLRRSSLDELPQVWNVLVGDMSLVGPRPMMPCQRPMYPGVAYYGLRPGMTGTWQISARNASDFARRADFDTGYDQDLSLSTDVVILVRTFGAVAHGTGH